MEQYILDALRKAIQHWKQVVNADSWTQVHIGDQYCALCIACPACYNCPVMLHTDMLYCQSTPFYRAETAFGNWVHYARNGTDTDKAKVLFKSAAKEELDLLKSLLPKE